MAKINNTAAYAISSPIDGSDIVIGSALGFGGDTKNFQMSDIAAYVMSPSVSTITLDQVCLVGSSTTTGITVAGTTTLNGVLDANSTADITGNTTIGGTLGVTGVSTLGEIDASGVADIADTLTLSKPSGTGLQVDADVNIDGGLTIGGSGTALLMSSGTASFNSALIASLAVTNLISAGTAPSSAVDTGTAGQIVVDTDYIYVCTATDTWKRVAIATW